MDLADFTEKASGKLIAVLEHPGIHAFVPNPVPRDFRVTSRIAQLIEQAGVLMGRLHESGDVIDPVADLLLRKEAIASNAIEGTITTARELYLFEAEEKSSSSSQPGEPRREVLNYARAMTHGVELLKTNRPMAANFMCELHEILMQGVRGYYKSPGKIRSIQNAISKTQRYEDARYVPPPAQYVIPCMTDLEKFINEDQQMPNLVRLAMFHYQFEAIHPYLDGNGRIGRLLVPLLLVYWTVLPAGLPRFYISGYFERNDPEYRDRMLKVSQNGEWNEWVEFFLTAVIEEIGRSLGKALELKSLRESFYEKVRSGPGKLKGVIDLIFKQPVIQVRDIVAVTGVSRPQAGNYATRLADLGILTPDRGQYRHFYYADRILKVFFEEPEVAGVAPRPNTQ